TWSYADGGLLFRGRGYHNPLPLENYRSNPDH
ncbi:unnamed protein product, partial [Didymodactylos carnosus]